MLMFYSVKNDKVFIIQFLCEISGISYLLLGLFGLMLILNTVVFIGQTKS